MDGNPLNRTGTLEPTQIFKNENTQSLMRNGGVRNLKIPPHKILTRRAWGKASLAVEHSGRHHSTEGPKTTASAAAREGSGGRGRPHTARAKACSEDGLPPTPGGRESNPTAPREKAGSSLSVVGTSNMVDAGHLLSSGSGVLARARQGADVTSPQYKSWVLSV